VNGAAAWAAWAALGISLLLLVVLVGVVVMTVRFWRKVSPTVAPMLAMFSPPAPDASLERIASTLEAAEHDGGATPFEPPA
jgi:hypothetical protein